MKIYLIIRILDGECEIMYYTHNKYHAKDLAKSLIKTADKHCKYYIAVCDDTMMRYIAANVVCNIING